MVLPTRPALVRGVCDHCHKPYDADDFVAVISADEILCPDCVLDHCMLEAS